MKLVQPIDAGNVRPGDLVMWVVDDSVGWRSSWFEVESIELVPQGGIRIGMVGDRAGFTVKRHAQVLVAR